MRSSQTNIGAARETGPGLGGERVLVYQLQREASGGM